MGGEACGVDSGAYKGILHLPTHILHTVYPVSTLAPAFAP